MHKLRIALLGNVNNNFYLLAKILNDTNEYDATIFVNTSEPYINQPESDDPSISNAYPHWIKSIKTPTIRLMRILPRLSALKRSINDFDLCILSGDFICLAPYLRIPVIFYPTGVDLTRMPFPQLDEEPYRFMSPKWMARQLFSLNLKKGIKKSTLITSIYFERFENALRKLSIVEGDLRLAKTYLPWVIDPAKIKKIKPDMLSKSALDLRSTSDFIVFSPSRLIDVNNYSRSETGAWKNNSLLVKGFAEFVSLLNNNLRSVPKLVFLENANSPDIDRIKALVTSLGIKSNVIWLKNANGFGYTRDELLELYSSVDVVADDFGAGWFGGVALEGLCCELPVLNHTAEGLMSKLYGSNPFLEANTSTGAAKHLMDLFAKPEYRFELGGAGREWTEKNHGSDSILIAIRNVTGEALRIAMDTPDKVDLFNGFCDKN
jgi:hypothetical protein